MRHKTNWDLVEKRLDELDAMLLPDWARPVVDDLRTQILPTIAIRRQKRIKALAYMRRYRSTPEGRLKHNQQNHESVLRKREELHGISAALSEKTRDRVRTC